MLKALELNGFKSFADKTRFEFPAGITVVVGPNGSGKSNIVDAIKWVLGEQSAKSLRGKDMSDVIFKGSSGANARRPANSATATIVLENTDRRFAFDADEVHVSRRVYRSGESEYLINGETSRLKDIKDLFRGTGVGTDAYSLIEQGKVERMLSTNAKDRRAIFEEAAGISRFKAKKIEAQRRLARVDGNLIRLADIVEEVGSRYRSVKAQASKATRYKEYSDRLQQLRTQVGWKDWRVFQEKIETIQAEIAEAREAEHRLEAEITERSASAKRFDSQLAEISVVLSQHQESAGTLREKIAQAESWVSLNQSRLADLNQRKTQLHSQYERATKRTAELRSRIELSDHDFETAEINFRDAADQQVKLDSELASLDDQIQLIRQANESRRLQHAQLLNLITQLGRQVSTFDTQVENLGESKVRLGGLVAQLESSLQADYTEQANLQREQERLQREAESNDSALADSRHRHDACKAELFAARERLGELSNQHIGSSQRADVIEELERSLEGINAGAKEILQSAQTAKQGPLTEVIGLVADLVSVNVQHAAIVDVALGELAQYVIVDGDQLINQIADESFKLNGRVGLIQLKNPPTLGADPNVNLNGAAGVIGRTDRLVQVQPEFQNFIRQVLGGTWVVKTLAEALHLQATRGVAESVRLVTLDGEIVESDGTVVAGPKSLTTGLVSRRSELRALKREIERLENEIDQYRTQIQLLTGHESEAELRVQQQISDNTELASQLLDQRRQAKSVHESIRRAEKQLHETRSDLESASARWTELNLQLVTERDRLVTQELHVSTLHALISDDDSTSHEASRQRARIEKDATLARVKLAKAEQLLDGLQARVAQNRQEFEEHEQSARQIEIQTQSDELASVTAQEQIELGNTQLANLKVDQAEIAELLTKVSQSRMDLDSQRRDLNLSLTEKRDQLRWAQDKIHQSQMRIEQVTMQRNQVAERLLDDYGIDIAAVQIQAQDDDPQRRDVVDEEISTLRKKLGEIGSVNLDALRELEELETRYHSMDTQYQDLVEAKATLEKIIGRIDADSRKLFVETLEAIRINFQKLFRQTFGGGQADITLEEGIDPLEAGVEIIATPPGKSQFNNSLLSGGEKALTAVSLLMAIFQFRPSPFCVLDEVDAPFDEANIGRFIDVLKSFLGWTRFVIVTHSKKTMTAATTLYGITMQESGVSKRVSVRFEDVSDDGEISTEAVKRSEDDAA